MTLDLLPPLRRAEIVAIDWSLLAPDDECVGVLPDHSPDICLQSHRLRQLRNGHGATEDLLSTRSGRQRNAACNESPQHAEGQND